MKTLFVCDVEGTIFEAKYKIDGTDYASTMWQPLAHCLGDEAINEERESHKKYENKEYKNYEEWVLATFEIHQKYELNKTQFDEVLSRAEYIDGVRDFFGKLDRNKYTPMLVSGGFQELIKVAQEDLHIRHGEAACEYIFDKKTGELVNCNTRSCDFDGKYKYVKKFIEDHQTDHRLTDWIFVGDGKNDVHVADEAPVSFGINAHADLAKIVTFNVSNFHQIYDLMNKYENFIRFLQEEHTVDDDLSSDDIDHKENISIIRKMNEAFKQYLTKSAECEVKTTQLEYLQLQLDENQLKLKDEIIKRESEENTRNKLAITLENLEIERNEYASRIIELTNTLEGTSENLKAENTKKLKILKDEIVKKKTEIDEILIKIKDQDEFIKTFSKEIDEKTAQISALTDRQLEFERQNSELKSIIDLDKSVKEAEEASANEFERIVCKTLKGTSKSSKGDWIVINEFDANPDGSDSMFTDILVISRHCIIVIEAKHYIGAIKTVGDVKNNAWASFPPIGKEKRVSSTGINPYHQLQRYRSGVRNKINYGALNDFPVYGIVVFPEEANISALGDDTLGRYYRIATLDKITGVIDKIEADIKRIDIHAKRPAPEKIRDVLLGRPSKLN